MAAMPLLRSLAMAFRAAVPSRSGSLTSAEAHLSPPPIRQIIADLLADGIAPTDLLLLRFDLQTPRPLAREWS